MRKMLPLLAATALFVPVSFVHAQQPPQKPLDIYFIDTEGGQATLFVSPSGQSMLVDTGFPGNQGAATPAEASAPGITRDADRITAGLREWEHTAPQRHGIAYLLRASSRCPGARS